MNRILFRFLLAIALVGASTAQAETEIVRIPTEDKVVINGVWFAPAKPTKSLVVLVPGLDGGVLFPGHDYGPLAKELNSRGYALLIPNMRTAALNFAYSTFESANEDLRGVVTFAKTKGIEDISLFGTSLGGPRVAWYLSQNSEPAIKTVGFLASLTSPYHGEELKGDTEGTRHFKDVVSKSRALLASGRSNELVAYDFTLGRTLPMSARSFLSFWGDPATESNASTTKFIETAVTVPTLVIHGTEDKVALPKNAEEIYHALKNAPLKDIVLVEGASHYLSSGWIAEAYGQRIAGWVAKNMPLR